MPLEFKSSVVVSTVDLLPCQHVCFVRLWQIGEKWIHRIATFVFGHFVLGILLWEEIFLLVSLTSGHVNWWSRLHSVATPTLVAEKPQRLFNCSSFDCHCNLWLWSRSKAAMGSPVKETQHVHTAYLIAGATKSSGTSTRHYKWRNCLGMQELWWKKRSNIQDSTLAPCQAMN